MVKGQMDETKQTAKFRLEDAMFFCLDAKGSLRQLTTNALEEEILSAERATLKLYNHKNGRKGVCVYQEHNGDQNFIPVRALDRRCVSILQNTRNKNTYLSAYWVGGKHKDVTVENTSSALKFSATALDYPSLKGIPVYRVDNISLRGIEYNAMLLTGYSNRDIQKMGRWRGETFK